nr:hypothetical protein [Tanacetum cinerariifolium]
DFIEQGRGSQVHLGINLLGKRQVHHRCECEQQNEGRNKAADKQEKAGLQELRVVEENTCVDHLQCKHSDKPMVEIITRSKNPPGFTAEVKRVEVCKN